MARSRAWLLVLAVPAAVLGALVLLVLAVLWALRPAPADEELVAWAAQRERSAERTLAVRTELGVEGGCGIEVLVQMRDGLPAPDTPVLIESFHGDAVSVRREAFTDDAGELRLGELPCGIYKVSARPSELAQDADYVELVEEVGPARVRLVIGEGMVVQGTVRGSDGEPVAEAELSAHGAETTTDDSGHYSLVRAPEGLGQRLGRGLWTRLPPHDTGSRGSGARPGGRARHHAARGAPCARVLCGHARGALWRCLRELHGVLCACR